LPKTTRISDICLNENEFDALPECSGPSPRRFPLCALSRLPSHALHLAASIQPEPSTESRDPQPPPQIQAA